MSNTEATPLIHNTREPSGSPRFAVFTCFIRIAQIIVGAINLDNCPRQPYIPIYLTVCGAFALMLMIATCLPCAKKPEDGSTNILFSVYSIWISLVSLFLLSWFIFGNMWIFSIYPPNYNKDTTDVDPYCDKMLYLFAFWVTIADYVLLGSFLFLFCFFFWFTCCKACVQTQNVKGEGPQHTSVSA